MSAGGAAPVRAAVEQAVLVLTEAGVASPRVDAMALAAHVLSVPHLVMAVAPPLPGDFEARYAALVDRRRRREPLQQILGFTIFRHLRLQLTPGVFVPRPETEMVAGAAIDEALLVARRHRPLVVDLCAGSGAIAASVALEVPSAVVVAVDMEPAAVALTRANLDAADALVDRVAHSARVAHTARVEQGSVTDPSVLGELDASVDVVVSNPPYIPANEVPADPEVRDHDPAAALYGGGVDGLDVPRAVAAAARRLLRADGLFVMEHGDAQGAAVRLLVHEEGEFAHIRTHQDLTHRDRYVTARRRPR